MKEIVLRIKISGKLVKRFSKAGLVLEICQFAAY